MTGIHWFAAFYIAAMGCLALGDVPPSQMRWGHPRLTSSLILIGIGVIGFVADIIFNLRTGATP